jgi:hypothetical protein
MIIERSSMGIERGDPQLVEDLDQRYPETRRRTFPNSAWDLHPGSSLCFGSLKWA